MKLLFDFLPYLLAGMIVAAAVMAVLMYLESRETKQRYEAAKKWQERMKTETFTPPVWEQESFVINLKAVDPVDAKIVEMMVRNATVGELDDMASGRKPKRGPGRPRKQSVH